MAVRVEPLAGLAVGKLVKFALKKIGAPTYEVAGMDIVKLGVGAAMVGISYYYGARLGRLEDIVGYAGAGMIIDEIAKGAGINPGEEKTIVVSQPTVSKPKPSVVIA